MGDYSEEKIATAEIQHISAEVQPKVEEKTGENYTVFIASRYRELDVTGFIYLIQVKVGGGSAVHVKVYKSQSKAIVLLEVQGDHSEGDKIIPF